MLIEIESGLVDHEEIRRVERTATGCNIFIRGSCWPHPSTLTVEDIFARLPYGEALRAPPLRASENLSAETESGDEFQKL